MRRLDRTARAARRLGMLLRRRADHVSITMYSTFWYGHSAPACGRLGEAEQHGPGQRQATMLHHGPAGESQGEIECFRESIRHPLWRLESWTALPEPHVRLTQVDSSKMCRSP